MGFKSMVLADIQTTVLNSDEFAETVTYKPLAAAQKSIKAVVFRNELRPIDLMTAGRGLVKTCRVIIANDATTGMTAVNKGQDKISFPEIDGGTPIDWLIHRVIGSDFSVWDLEVIK